MNTEHPGQLILKALCYILDQTKGLNKKFVFYWNEIKYIVEIKKYKSKRSIDQNSVLWMWLSYLENQTGNDKNDLYRMFERKFQPWTKIELKPFGVFYLPKPIKKSNTSDFNNYLESLRKDVVEQTGYWLPLPDENEWENFFISYKNK
jgi:hypothetical protein